MSIGGLLDIEPLQLQFPIVLKKQTSCPLKLSNNTKKNIAFKVLTTDPKKYCVRPNMGIILPQTTCEVVVIMQAQKKIRSDMQCKDKFMIQSVFADPGATSKDITANMFKKEAGNRVKECKLRAVYVFPPQVSSPVAQGSEGSSFKAVETKDVNLNVPEVAKTLVDTHDKSSEVAKTLVDTHDKSSERKMGMGNFLELEPLELTFPFELKKQISSSVQFSNTTDKHIAFKVKTTKPEKYFVRPNMGIIMPQSRCDVTVIMQAQKEAPPDMQCEDEFMIQSVVASPGATINEITTDMFNDSVEESKLKVVYISPSRSPNLVGRTSEEGSSARTSMTSQRKLGGPEYESLRRIGAWFVFGVTIGLLFVIFWYLMKMTISFIWSFVIVMMMKMTMRIVSDSLEDWVVKAFVFVILHFLSRYKNREHES